MTAQKLPTPCPKRRPRSRTYPTQQLRSASALAGMLLAATVVVPNAHAQDDGNPFAAASGGQAVEFAPGAPHQTFEITAGGETDSRPFSPGTGWNSECRGFINPATPHFRIQYTRTRPIDETVPFQIRVTSEKDTALIVRKPDGSFSCTDDIDGVNPQMGWGGSADVSGEYLVWVTAYRPLEDTTSATTVPASVTIGGEPYEPIPEPVERDRGLERNMLREARELAETYEWEASVEYVIIVSDSWRYENHPISGRVVRRHRIGNAVTQKPGYCTVTIVNYSEPAVGRRFDARAANVHFTGNTRVDCAEVERVRRTLR